MVNIRKLFPFRLLNFPHPRSVVRELIPPSLLVQCLMPQQESNRQQGNCKGNDDDAKLEEQVHEFVEFTEEAHDTRINILLTN